MSKRIVLNLEDEVVTRLESVRSLFEARLSKRVTLEEVIMSIVQITARRFEDDAAILQKGRVGTLEES